MSRTAAFVALLLFPALAWCGVVAGTVVDAVTKRPVAGATVRLFRGDDAVHTVQSDEQGRFRFADVAEGQYRAEFRNDDYVAQSPFSPAARPFAVSAAPGEVRMQVELTPRGTVSGRVTSPSGRAVNGAGVGMRRPWQRHWSQTTVTGERGEFRIARLDPGAWILAALPMFKMTGPGGSQIAKPMSAPEAEEGQRVAWTTTFFPGVAELAGAAKLIVRPGMELEGHDIRLRTTPVYRLSGVVLDENGLRVAKAGIVVSDLDNGGVNGDLISADAEGRFEFDRAQAGEWRLLAQGGTKKGYADVRVGRRDVSGVEVRVTSPFEVRGLVERDEPRDKDGLRKRSGVYLIPDSPAPDMQETAFHAQDGSFVLKRVYAGRYRVLPVGFLPGYYLESVWYGDQDVTTQALEIVNPPLALKIVYRDGAAAVSGKVERGAGAWVVLVPKEEALRDSDQFVRSTKCDEEGIFSLGSLRPGEYYAFAFDRVEKEMLEDVEFVRRVAGQAASVSLKRGQTERVELRPQMWPEY